MYKKEYKETLTYIWGVIIEGNTKKIWSECRKNVKKIWDTSMIFKR